MEKMRFEGKVVIVTGASSGIGRSTARLFAMEGAKVVAAARRLKRLEDLRDKVAAENAPGVILPVKTDVRDPAQIEAMFDTCLKEFGHLDILVNNAGVLDGQLPIHETPQEVYDMIYETNQRAVYLCCQRAIKIFLEQGTPANIVNVASAASLRGLEGRRDVRHNQARRARPDAQHLRFLLRAQASAATGIEPANILTEINKVPREKGIGILEWQMRAGKAAPLHTITKPGEKKPMLGKPKDCANAIAYLADDVAARYISGAELKVDAGWLNM